MATVINGTDNTAATPALTGTDTDTGVFFPAANTMAFSTGGTEQVRVESAGNVIIGGGSTNPFSNKLYVTGTPTANAPIIGLYSQGNSSTAGIGLYNDSGNIGIWSSGANTIFRNNANLASGIETMRIDSNGALLVGKNADSALLNGFLFNANGRGSATFTMADTNETFIWNNLSTTGTAIIDFRTNGISKGKIQWDNSNTTFATTSDYRLKENIAPMTGALNKVAQLKPVTYRWKSTGEESQGFIAHELQEVVPDCVTGEKDAVETIDIKDEEGKVIGQEEKPVYQGIDTSFLVATLTAALQELKATVDAQAARIAALENPAAPTPVES
jgi:hypothetical protein